MNKLQKLAQDCPHCMSCGIENPNRDLLCLAHSNAMEDDRGYGYKSRWLYGAYLCFHCHNLVDGRQKQLSKDKKREMHRHEWVATMRWLIDNDHLEVK